MQLIQKALADLAEFHLPPWSDIRSHAEALQASHQYVTFLDVLPMLRLAQTMVHLPEASLAALTALHDGPSTTDGARALLVQLAHDYYLRVRKQRALAQREITAAHKNRSIRVAVGAGFVVALAKGSHGPWQWAISDADAAPIWVEAAHSPRRDLQRFAVHAIAPGTCTLEALQPGAPSGGRKLSYRVIVDPAPL